MWTSIETSNLSLTTIYHSQPSWKGCTRLTPLRFCPLWSGLPDLWRRNCSTCSRYWRWKMSMERFWNVRNVRWLGPWRLSRASWRCECEDVEYLMVFSWICWYWCYLLSICVEGEVLWTTGCCPRTSSHMTLLSKNVLLHTHARTHTWTPTHINTIHGRWRSSWQGELSPLVMRARGINNFALFAQLDLSVSMETKEICMCRCVSLLVSLSCLQIMIELLAYFSLTIDNQMIIIFVFYLFFVRWWDSRLESHGS